MQIGLLCTACAAADTSNSPKLFWAEVQDDGAQVVKCDKGHVTVYLLQEQKFELLFELGLHAIVDGYYREAVSSFATSLERFHEYALRVFAHSSAVDSTRFAEAWLAVARQSERQLGAYIFCHLTHEGTMPRVLSEKYVAFRNEVVHKGKIPKRDEAINFAEVVLNTVFESLRLLRTKYGEACEAAALATNESIRQKYEKIGACVVGVSYPMTLRNVSPDTTKPPSIVERLGIVSSIMRPGPSAA